MPTPRDRPALGAGGWYPGAQKQPRAAAASRSPMLPLPTTAASSSAVPIPSATTLRIACVWYHVHGGCGRLRRTGVVEAAANGRHRQPQAQAGSDAMGGRRERAALRALPVDRRGILEAPVDPLRIARKHGTDFGRAIANGNHIVEALAEERIH